MFQHNQWVPPDQLHWLSHTHQILNTEARINGRYTINQIVRLLHDYIVLENYRSYRLYLLELIEQSSNDISIVNILTMIMIIIAKSLRYF